MPLEKLNGTVKAGHGFSSKFSCSSSLLEPLTSDIPFTAHASVVRDSDLTVGIKGNSKVCGDKNIRKLFYTKGSLFLVDRPILSLVRIYTNIR